MPPTCLPNCFCNECLPQRVRALESTTPLQQRAFWERVATNFARAQRPAAAPSTNQQPPRSQPAADLFPNPQSPRGSRRHSDSTSSTQQPPHHGLQSPPRPTLPPPTRLPPPPPVAHTAAPPPVDLATLFPPLPSGEGGGVRLSAYDNPFGLPEHVLYYVHNINDAFESILRRLDSATPRRKQCMLEAMQRVATYFEQNVPAPIITTPVPITVDHLATQIFSKTTCGDTDRKECTFCQEDFQDGEELVLLPCSHLFHNTEDCFKGWIKEGKRVCANCRADLAPKS